MLGHVVSLVRLVVRDVPLLRGGAVERVRLDVGARRVAVRDGIDHLRVGGARLDHVRAVGNGSSAFLGLRLLGGVGRGVGVRRVRGSSCRLRLRISRTVDLANGRRLLLPRLLRGVGRRGRRLLVTRAMHAIGHCRLCGVRGIRNRRGGPCPLGALGCAGRWCRLSSSGSNLITRRRGAFSLLYDSLRGSARYVPGQCRLRKNDRHGARTSGNHRGKGYLWPKSG